MMSSDHELSDFRSDSSGKNYTLNQNKAKAKMVFGTELDFLRKEEKENSVYYQFNTGAFAEVVMKTLQYLKGVEYLIVNEEQLNVDIEDRNDKENKVVETVVKFTNSSRKIVMNIY